MLASLSFRLLLLAGADGVRGLRAAIILCLLEAANVLVDAFPAHTRTLDTIAIGCLSWTHGKVCGGRLNSARSADRVRGILQPVGL